MAGRWQKGQSGNPGGKPRSHPADRVLTDALRIEVMSEPRKARRIARKLLQMAEDGDIRAATLIFERLEGKAPNAPEEIAEAPVTIEERVGRILELQSRVVVEDLEPIEIGLIKGDKE
jgi:proline racemase